MSTPSESIGLCKILSESRRIIKSQVHHFQALLVIFLIPFTFSMIIYPFLLKTIFRSQSDSPLPIPILINFLYILFATLLSICAVASISYSSFNALFGTPVDLITSIKSIFQSFFPLVSTLIVQEIIRALIFSPFLYQPVKIFGSKSFYNSSSSYIAFIVITTLFFLLVMIYLQANWILASVIAVVESKWGFVPMQRSAKLVKGKRGVAVTMILYFALMLGGFVWVFYPRSSSSWEFIVYTMTTTLGVAMIMLLSLVSNVVLYVYCMEMHGELLPYLRRAEEFPLLK